MKATPATLPRFRARLWPLAVASLIAASALAGHAAPAHAAALHPAQPLDCATSAIQAPSFAVDNDPNSMFWYGLDTSSTSAQTLAGNTMAVQLTNGTCTFTGSIDNNGTFTSAMAAVPAGTYTVSQASFAYQATVWLTNPRTHSQYQGNVPCTLSGATFTFSGTYGNTVGNISGHENCQGQVASSAVRALPR